MSYFAIPQGSATPTLLVVCRDATTGNVRNDLTNASAGASANYARFLSDGTVTTASFALAALASLATAWTPGGFRSLGFGGLYRLDLPAAAAASSASLVAVIGHVAFTGVDVQPIGAAAPAYNPLTAPSTPADIATAVDAAVADNFATVGTAIAALPTATAVRDAILNAIVEGTVTVAQAYRLWTAMLAGQASGLATGGTPTYKSLDGTKTRASFAGADADGNRPAVSTGDLT